MKSIYTLVLLLFLIFPGAMLLAQSPLDDYVKSFSYETRNSMKISGEEITDLLIKKEAILLDIRFEEEHRAWAMDYALKIPLNELPLRLAELPKDKLIVTACPHKDRAIMAMMYLIGKGYKTAYLGDGLLGLAEHLRGDKAKEFIEQLN